MIVKQLFRWIPIILGLAVLFLLIFQSGVDWIQTFELADPAWVLLTIAVIGINLLVHGFKWKTLLGFYGHTISTVQATRIFCLGTMVGLLTPLKIGIFVRAWLVHPLSKTNALASIVVDRLSDIGIIALGGFLALVFFTASSAPSPLVEKLLQSSLVILAAIAIFLFQTGLFRNMLRAFLKRMTRLAQHGLKVEALLQAIAHATRTPSQTISIGILSVLGFVTAVAYYYAMGQALHVSVPWLAWPALVAFSLLIETVPVTALGIGTREAFWVVLAPQFNMTISQAILVPLGATLLSYAWVCLWGGSLLREKSIQDRLASFNSDKGT